MIIAIDKKRLNLQSLIPELINHEKSFQFIRYFRWKTNASILLCVFVPYQHNELLIEYFEYRVRKLMKVITRSEIWISIKFYAPIQHSVHYYFSNIPHSEYCNWNYDAQMNLTNNKDYLDWLTVCGIYVKKKCNNNLIKRGIVRL